MQASHKLAIALTTCVAIGAAVAQGLHAQARPPTYVVIDISEIADPEGFKEIAGKTTPASFAEFGGRYVMRTENITAIEGTPPKRFVVIAFDSVENAKAFLASPNQKEVQAIRAKTAKSREFVVEGM